MRVGAAALLGVACLVGPASAQALPRLGVTTFGMDADARIIPVAQPFHLTIRVVIDKRRDALDELVLPDLSAFTVLGDDRVTTPLANGATQFDERMTLAGNAEGTYDIPAAYLDAINDANGQPERFSSNTLSVTIAAGSRGGKIGSTFDTAWSSAIALLIRMVALLAFLAVIAAFARALMLHRWRRPRPNPPVAPSVVAMSAQPIQPLSADERLRDAWARYRTSRDEATLLPLRGELFTRAGTSAGATLADALRAVGSDVVLRAALIACEHAAFAPRLARDEAADELIRAVAAILATQNRGS